VQSKALAVEIIEQESADNDRVEKEVGIEADLGLIHRPSSTESKAPRLPPILELRRQSDCGKARSWSGSSRLLQKLTSARSRAEVISW
jgi:hypothetical protein